jgi:phosphoribosyl 1,2-cyclic phosphate phosphodiesterase
MTFATVLSAMEKLRAQGCLHARSNIILSHISHTSALLHKEMVARWQPHGVTVAWDGLIID